MASDDSYRRIWIAARRPDNYPQVFDETLEKLSKDVDFGWVKTCVGIGTSNAECEFKFARRVLPNLRTFTAVEPDPQSVKELRDNVENGQLPGVEVKVDQTTGQNWKGPDEPVDAILLFHILFHFPQTERRALLQTLTKHVAQGGVVIIVTNSHTKDPGNAALIYERLGHKVESYEDIEEDTVAMGFRLEAGFDIQGVRDFTDPDEDFLKFFQHVTKQPVSLEEVRSAILELFPQGKCDQYYSKLAVFKKQ